MPIKISLFITLILFSNSLRAEFPPVINLNDLDGTNGFNMPGVSSNAASSNDISDIGDFNGDGIDDIIIGSPRAGGSNTPSGLAHMIYGKSTAFSETIILQNLTGNTGLTFEGPSLNDRAGTSVTGIGDFNNDGFDDIAISAIREDENEQDSGTTYVVFGRQSISATVFNLGNMNGVSGFAINGYIESQNTGIKLSAAGDFNNDGFDDFIILSDFNLIELPTAYVIFGNNDQFNADIDLSTLDGTRGFKFTGQFAGTSIGGSTASLGDINSDGIDDIIIGCGGSNSNTNCVAYIVYGTSTVIGAEFNLGDIDGTNGFTIEGLGLDDDFAETVASGGDFNNDGSNDILITAKTADSSFNAAGDVFLIYGGLFPNSASYDLSQMSGVDGFKISGLGSLNLLGSSADGLGDVNGDGIDDIVIGASNTDANNNDTSGTAYIVFGLQNFQNNEINLADLDGEKGFIVNGLARQDLLGRVVTKAGDINDDNVNEVFIGAPGADPNGFGSGESYIIFGISDIIFENSFE